MTAPRAVRWRGRAPERWTVAGWTGMYDSKAKSSERDGQAPLLFNLRPLDADRTGPLELRPGMKRVLAGGAGSTALQLGTVGARTCQAMFNMPGVGPCIVVGGEIYSLNFAAGTSTKLVSQANFTTAGITFSTSTAMLYTFLGNDLVACHHSGRPWTWDGTSGAGGLTSLTNAPASVSGLTTYYAKVFVLTTSRYEIQWSEENQPNVGYTAGGYNNAWTLSQTSTQQLRALLGTNEGLYIFREDSVGVIRGAVSSTFSTDGVQDSVFIGSGADIASSVLLAGQGTVWWIDDRRRIHAYRPGVGVIPAWQSLTRWLQSPGFTSSEYGDNEPYGVGEDWRNWDMGSQLPVLDPVNRRVLFPGYDNVSARRIIFVFDADSGELLTIERYPAANPPGASGSAPHLGILPLSGGGSPTWMQVYVDENGYVFQQPMSGESSTYVRYYDETHDGAGEIVVGQLLGPMHGWDTGIEWQFTQLDVIADAALDNVLTVGYLTSRRHKLSISASVQTYSDTTIASSLNPYERRIPFGLNANGRWLRPLIRLSGSTNGLQTRQLLHGYTLTGYAVSSGPKVT
jgi:hypothetical protein